jgi:dihydrofolate reductase
MAVDTFKITIHMVSSLDGYIAKKDNSTSWFETTDNYGQGLEVTEEQAASFLKTIDCYVMGSRTYEHALELSKSYGWVYGDVPTFVLTHRNREIERENIKIYSGDLHQFVNEQLRPNYKNVWVVGGAELATSFLSLQLADEIRQSVLPIILGDGMPFFQRIAQEQALKLKNVTAYKNGMVELYYQIKK